MSSWVTGPPLRNEDPRRNLTMRPAYCQIILDKRLECRRVITGGLRDTKKYFWLGGVNACGEASGRCEDSCVWLCIMLSISLLGDYARCHHCWWQEDASADTAEAKILSLSLPKS